MAVLFFLALVLFSGSSCSLPQHRILGGNPTTIQDYPSVVQIEVWAAFQSRVWLLSCGGTILNSLNVLTAYRCVFRGHDHSLRIRAGATYRNTGGLVIPVQSTVIHPNANMPHHADIALARLIQNLQYNSYIQPARIIVPGFNVPDNVPVVYAGWGYTSEMGPQSDVLRQLTVPTINRDTCRDIYRSLLSFRNISDNVICTGELGVGGKDTCAGDYGGPLFYQDIVVGVSDFIVPGCARPDVPGIATAVSPYTSWIIANAV